MSKDSGYCTSRRTPKEWEGKRVRRLVEQWPNDAMTATNNIELVDDNIIELSNEFVKKSNLKVVPID